MSVNQQIVTAFVNKITSLLGAKANSADFGTIRVIVTYIDNSTATVDLYRVPASNNNS